MAQPLATRRSIACLDAEVLRIQDLSPSFRRFTFSGPGMDRFGIDGPPLDLRIKLLVPMHPLEDLRSGTAQRFDLAAFLDEKEAEGVSWYQAWLQLPAEERGAMRTYTVRAWREDVRELDMDVVLHTPADRAPLGPAEAWAREAQVGDRLHILGPDRDAAEIGGIEFRPASTRDLLLVGDETAVPAICSILESLPADACGRALLEVPSADDQLEVSVPDGVCIEWLDRGDAPQGQRLGEAVEKILQPSTEIGEVPLEEVDIDHSILWETVTVPPPVGEARARTIHGVGNDFYAWIAGEAGAVTGIRRHLVKRVGIDRRQVAFMGYWRIGRAEG